MEEHARALRRILGESFVDDPLVASLYVRDASPIVGREVVGVAFPKDVEELRRLVRYAYRHDLKLYPQGSATSLSGNPVPTEPGVVVSFERMCRIIEVNTVDGYVIVEPGVRMEELNAELFRLGYFFPIDPASQRSSTIGGAINNGAGGMRGAKYGVIRDWVLGLELVLPDEDASVVNIGCRTLKCRQGYDLVRLIVGSEGTLALVTKAVLRITPLPESVVGVTAQFDDVHKLANAVVETRGRRLVPLFSEFLDDRTSEVVGLGRRHTLFIGVEIAPEASGRVLKVLEEVIVANGGELLQRAVGWEEVDKMLEPRRKLNPVSVSIAQRELGNDYYIFSEDVAVPLSKIGEAVRRIRRAAEDLGLPLVIGGHVGDGNLHPRFWVKRSEVDRAWRMFNAIVSISIELGGTISGEHGIGLMKREGLRAELEKIGGAKALELMKMIKRVFDPKNILNPGKIT